MVIKYTNSERDLLARLMRAEAIGEGALGMLMVGNVTVNRVLADCYTFKNITTLFYGSPTSKERDLANRVIKGEYYHPATNALWFYAPGNKACLSTWYDQPLAGQYKNHCFYEPVSGACNTIH